MFFNSGSARIKAAGLQEKVAINRAGNFSRELSGKYRGLLEESARYNHSIEYYEKEAIPQAELIIEQATLSYKAGAMDYLDYILNLSQALEIKQNYLKALNNYNQTIINIEFISGKIF